MKAAKQVSTAKSPVVKKISGKDLRNLKGGACAARCTKTIQGQRCSVPANC